MVLVLRRLGDDGLGVDVVEARYRELGMGVEGAW